MGSENLEKALQRPDNYNRLTLRRQWEIDEALGILDWDPTPEEIEEYKRRHGRKCRDCQHHIITPGSGIMASSCWKDKSNRHQTDPDTPAKECFELQKMVKVR